MGIAKLQQRIGLGTVQFGLNYGISNQTGKPNSNQVDAILKCYQKYGGSTLDTSSAYGNALDVLGDVKAGEKFKIVSKVKPGTTVKTVGIEMDEQLKSLKQKRIYALLIHSFADYKNDKHLFEALKEQKENGRVEKIGFSFYNTEELDLVLQNGHVPDLVQVPFNLLDQRFLPQFKLLKQQGVEIHTRSSFLQGLLFYSKNELPAHFGSIKNLLESLHELQVSYGWTRLQLLLNFALSYPEVDKVVLGVNQLVELEEIFNSISGHEPIDYSQFRIEDINLINPALWPKK